MAKIKWSVQALADVEAIGKYIEAVSFQYAKSQVARIVEKAAYLEKYPMDGRPVPELANPSIRQLLCGSYRIIYEVESEGEVTILTVHHQSRLLKNNPVFKDSL